MQAPERVDPLDTKAFDKWYDVHAAALAFGRPYPTEMTRDETLVALTYPNEFWDNELWMVRDEAGAVVGTLNAELPLKDNTNVLSVQIGVRPDRRRRGIGSALFAQASKIAAGNGRTVLQAEVDAPMSGVSPGSEFARACGFTLANTEVHRVLELPLSEALLDELAAEAAERHEGYRMVTWRDRCPGELVDAYAELNTVFSAEAPLGDLEWEPEHWDAERVRYHEGKAREQKWRTWTTVAVAPDGRLAGHTLLVLPDTDPGKAYQQATLVKPAHRGHRLGLAMKVRNHRDVHDALDGPVVAHTWNAEQNTHMNAVNALLGYRQVEHCQEWQRQL